MSLRRWLGLRPARVVVGRDRNNNTFYMDGDRRGVDFAQGHLNMAVHPAWRAWLSGQRPDPPSAEEIERRERELDALRGRVAQLTLEDEKLRAVEQFERERHQ